MSFVLTDYCVDLVAQARAGRLDPVHGRAAEIARLVRILVRKTKNNPLLLGEPGVGKTAIVDGFALRLAAGDVPAALTGRSLLALNLGSLLAGTGYRGDFEERMRALVAELRKPGTGRILFVDEIHLLGRAGKSEGGLDAGNLLKPLLARGELPCIGATTPAEWEQLVRRDPALERRFQPISVDEPADDVAIEMLRGLRPRFERHHGVEITEGALLAAIVQSAGAGPARRLPDRAVDLLDEACALLRLQAGPVASEMAVAEQALGAAEYVFDLDAVARLRFRELPRLQGSTRKLRLDAAAIAAVREGDAVPRREG